MKVLKVFLILIISLVMGALLYFLGEASVIDSIALSYFVVIESFLGQDLRGMIKESRAMKKGDYKDIHLYRYITVSVIFLVLEILAIYVYKVLDVNVLVSMSLFGGGFIITIGMILSGLQENKIASETGPE